MKLKLAVVIPNWNGKDYLRDCLHSLENQSIKTRIVVVDNGSSDGSIELVEKDFPDAELIKLDSNQGFTGGVNRGIEYVLHDVDAVALLNNDAVADKQWLETLATTLQAKPGVGIVTGKLLQMDKKHIDSTGELLARSGMPSPRGRGQIDESQHDSSGYVFGASGGASLYRAAMLKKIGLFDEDFFAYFEDADLSFRAQLAGWKVLYQPAAVAYHHIGQTSNKLGSFTRYHSVKNYILLYNKNMPSNLYWKYKPRFFWQLTRMKLGSLRDGEFGAYVRAFFKALWLMPSTLKKRRAIQKHRAVSLEYVDSLLERKPKP